MVASPFGTMAMAPWKGALCTARPPRGSSPAPRPKGQTHTLLRAWSAGFSALTFWKRLKRSWLGYLCVAAHAAPPSGSPRPSAPLASSCSSCFAIRLARCSPRSPPGAGGPAVLPVPPRLLCVASVTAPVPISGCFPAPAASRRCPCHRCGPGPEPGTGSWSIDIFA